MSRKFVFKKTSENTAPVSTAEISNNASINPIQKESKPAVVAKADIPKPQSQVHPLFLKQYVKPTTNENTPPKVDNAKKEDSALLSCLVANELKISKTDDLYALFDNNDDDFIVKKTPSKPVESSVNKQPKLVIPNSSEKKPVVTSKRAEIQERTKPKTIEVDHVNRCPSCKSTYSEKGANRRIVDTCGHGICVKCVVLNNNCLVCESLSSSSSAVNHNIESSPDQKQNVQSPSLEDSPVLLKKPVASVNKPAVSDNFDLKPMPIRKNLDFFSAPKAQPPPPPPPPPQPQPQKTFQPAKVSKDIWDDDDDDLFEIDSIDIRPKTSNNSNVSNNISNNMNNNMAKKGLHDEITVIGDEEDDDDDDDLLIDDDIDFVSAQPNQRQNSTSSGGNMITKCGVSIPNADDYERVKWSFNDIRDCSLNYRSLDYEHTPAMLSAFKSLFGLKAFRPQQFEAINSALLGHNCFILMPTGGGKSLIYQLPAILGKGVTFVVSPLKSLIIDQTQKLNALNLAAANLLSDSDSGSDCDGVYYELAKMEPRLKLIYITPEKLNNSGKLRNIIANLYARNMISRLVIDEAHCVSQWGHDFRTDYKKLGEVRNQLIPNVPVMLLTATATPRVRNDILIQMKLSCSANASNNRGNSFDPLTNKLNNRNYMSAPSLATASRECDFFMQSFNRENLQYKVEYKTSNQAALEKIIDLIKSKYSNKSGIVYCISRNECESVCDHLRKNGIKALAYHAGMDDKKRAAVQHKWMSNIDCRVVCATIAFGMGIDKADVRYVVHLGLPKSLEGYYQESGRAGRDGLVSLCLLFYNNQDRHKWLRLIKSEQMNGGPGFNSEAYKTHVDNIYRMAHYCDNRLECRRAQILEYFGEHFDRKKCIESKLKTICDNCQIFASNSYSKVDLTQEAMLICKGVQQIGAREDVTLLHLGEVVKGSMNAKVVEKGHNNLEMHSKLAKYKKNDIERFLRKLVFCGYLKEDIKILSHSDTVASYIKLGPKANELLYSNNHFTKKIEFELFDDDSSGTSAAGAKTSKMPKANSKVGSLEFSSTIDSNTVIPGKATASNTKLSESNEINRILHRCQTDLKHLIKRVGSESQVKNINNVFTTKMLIEMLRQLPQNRQELMGITGYTEAIFDKYGGEKFLEIFRHYAQLKKGVEDEEKAKALRKRQEEFAKQKASATVAAIKQSKTYGLLDNGDNDIYNAGSDDDEPSISARLGYDFSTTTSTTTTEWMAAKSSKATTSSGYSQQYKRKSNSNNYSNKKFKSNSGYDSSNENNSARKSNYFKKPYKKKFNNFKKKYNKFKKE